MQISVITVCFNSAATISRTLHSVNMQTHGDIEHIIIDGGSTDNTLRIVAHEGRRVTKIISERDDGIYDAMNKGIRLAKGEVLVFLNADDFYKGPELLARVAKIMELEKLDALYGDVEFFSVSQPDVIVRRYNSGRFTSDRLGWGWMPAHPALFVRRDLFKRFGEFRTEYKIAGDFEFVARVFKNSELRHRHLSESMVRMQLGGASTSGWRATLTLNREMIRACRSNDISTNWFKLLVRYPLKAVELFRTTR